MRVVELHGPGDAPFVQLIRVASLSFASQAGLAIDPCDELRLAIDEACFVLVALGSEALAVTLMEDETTLTVSVRTTEPVLFPMAAATTLILKTMTDHFFVSDDGALILEKRLP